MFQNSQTQIEYFKQSTFYIFSLNLIFYFAIFFLFLPQTEIAKRLSALINQLLPCLQPEHQQSVLQAVERAKQVTMPELNAIIGVSI